MPTKIHPAVTGSVRLLHAPTPGSCGLISINGKTYAISYIGARPGHPPAGYRLCSGEADIYDLPADLRTCECHDYLTRTRADGMCKHLKALRALLAAEKID